VILLDWSICFLLVRRGVHESPYAQWLFPEVDQKAKTIASSVQVEQALFDVFRINGAFGLGFQDEFVSGVIPDEKIHAAFGDHHVVVGDGDLDLALVVHAALR